MPPKKPQRKNPDNEALDRYRRMRDFQSSPEPGPAVKSGGGAIFVVQEHHARSHHFDLRLELDGVLKSWAVPKGPSLDPGVKRLAVMVEDHPVAYASFQGIIPPGNYGAGKVEIWDKGTWEPAQPDDDAGASLAKGRLRFRLHGGKLKGDFLLARISTPEDASANNWLLRKVADQTTSSQPRQATARAASDSPIAPQLCKLSTSVPRGAEWLHEIKFDGYRLIARKRGDKVALITRGGHDWTKRFGKLSEHIAGISPNDFSLDGEVVVMDGGGRSDFGLLQEALKSGRGENLVFAAFDLLDYAGRQVAPLPLTDRKQLLRELVPDDRPHLLYSRHWIGHAEGLQLYRQACKMNLEGIISKDGGKPYLPGSRHTWRKIKCSSRQEFVICGYTPPKHPGDGFGALVMGSYESGRLIPRGKVGTGFSQSLRLEILEELEERRIMVCPFDHGQKDVGVTWVRPDLVAEVKFAELTKDGFIRHGSFAGLREDKPAMEVGLEMEPEKPMAEDTANEVEGIIITHPAREIYPGTGITKLDLARYYSRVAPLILPHLVNRPLAFLRAPSGITGQVFFQKHFSAHLPKGVKMRTLKDDGSRVCHVSDAAGLLSLVQFGVIEFHPWGSPLARPDKPDTLIWDLDPEASVPWEEILGAAFLLRDILSGLGLHPVVKTSGGKGLHVVVHCKPRWTWDRLKPFTKAISEQLVAHNPKRLTLQAAKSKRTGKIFIDWLRNGRGATCIAPWSARARGAAPVSLPLDWKDLPQHGPDSTTITNINPQLPDEWLQAAGMPDEIPAGLLEKLGV
jgi:bifunctional non-homologous end joining protein LigD